MGSGTPREIEEVRRGGRLALAVAGSVDLSGGFAERGPTGNRRVKTGEDDKVMVGQEERERTQAAGQAAARKWM